jgi:hypothetical protein
MPLIPNIKAWYWKYERILSSCSLVGGFIFDIFALQRVDLFIENFWILTHLLVAAAGIVFINLLENTRQKLKASTAGIFHFWLIIVIQFSFGGLLSTFLVFYFRAATLAASWPFFLFLAAAFVCNEVLKHHYDRLVFQVSLLFLSIYAFAIYGVPIIVHRIGDDIFVLSGLVSLAAIWLFLMLMRAVSHERFRQSRIPVLSSIVVIFVVMNILYFANLIPPLPLSIKDSGVFHSIQRQADGNFVAEYEDQGWLGFFRLSDIYHEVPGEPVYVFTAVFSPAELNTTIIHRWEYFDNTKRSWITETKIPLSIIGGRGEGYRTYSYKKDLTPGFWRVDAETESGASIGRINFKIIAANSTPNLVEVTK